MKKTLINKFAVSAIALVSGLSMFASTAFAAGSFNPDPSPWGTGILSAAIEPTNTIGISNTANPQPGDVVALNIYYHNNGNQTINNVKIRFSPASTGAATNHVFTGTLSGQGVATITDTATVTVGTAQSLTFIPGSVRWFPNQTGQTNTAGQSISAQQEQDLVGGNGLDIGALTAGWPSQGGIVAKFQVSRNGGTVNPPVDNGQAPSVTTYTAQPISNSLGNATLRGIYDSNGYTTTTSFRYRMIGNSSWITVDQQNRGISNGNLSYTVTGLSSGTYEFEAVATNQYGTTYGGVKTFTINNTNTNCPSGYSWNGNACVQDPINCPSGYYLSGNTCIQNVQNCPAGFILSGNTCVQQNQSSAPTVTTLGAISVGGTVAVVDGFYNANGCATYTYFEYGTTQALGNRTGEVFKGTATGSMAQSISGLTQGSTYYYRAVARNCAGTNYGSILSLTTTRTVVNDTTIVNVVNNTGGAGGNSMIRLMIDNHRETVRGGTEIAYDVSWENLTTRDLEDLILQVNFPSQMTVIDADRGEIERNQHSVVYQIDELEARESGEMTIIVQITGALREGDPVVAQAIMAFENPRTNATENAIGYDADEFRTTGSVLGASLFGLGFLPSSLGGWLIILLIILLIIILARYFMSQNQNKVVVNTAPNPSAGNPAAGAQPGNDYIVYNPTPKI